MSKVRLMVILGFAMAFAAGASVGMLISLPQAASADRPSRPGDLAEQLGLSAQQREQMHKIWGEFVMGRDKEFRDSKREIWQAKDEAIENLLTQEQRSEYDAICADCELRLMAMDQQWQTVIDQAVEKTKAILTPEQAKKYEEFRSARQAWRTRGSKGGGRFSPGDHGMGRRGPASATAPAEGATRPN